MSKARLAVVGAADVEILDHITTVKAYCSAVSRIEKKVLTRPDLSPYRALFTNCDGCRIVVERG